MMNVENFKLNVELAEDLDSNENSQSHKEEINLIKQNNSLKGETNQNKENFILNKVNENNSANEESIDKFEDYNKNDSSVESQFDLYFPDFYEVDLIGYLPKLKKNKKDNYFNEKKSVNLNMNTILENNSVNSSLVEDDEFVSFSLVPLMKILNDNKIFIFQTNSFKIENLIIQHRESIYKGKLELQNKEIEVYLKKYSINNEDELNIVLNELEIISLLSNKKHSISKMISYLYGVYIDKEDNYLYTFFEYLPQETSNLTMNLVNLNYFQKLIILKNLLQFTFELHNLGIIHRDIRLEYFYVDPKCNIKTFEFTNALKMEMYKINENDIKDMKDVNDIKELENVINQINYAYDIPYMTAKYPAPEITICQPREGWAQDIWSLGCCLIELFLDYSKYEDGMIEILINKIFQGENNLIPRIPKDLEQNVAMILAKCFYMEPFSRLDTLQLIEKFNRYFKKNHFEIIEINQEDKTKFTIFKELCKQNYIVKYFKYKKLKETPEDIDFCRYHKKNKNNFYCETCDGFFCEYCILQTHGQHCYFDTEIDIQFKQKVLQLLGSDMEDKFCETNFVLIDEFRKTFQNDHKQEEKRIKKQYQEIREKIDLLEKTELENLEKSKNNFLEKKFMTIFSESDKVSEFYKVFYNSKEQFYSHFNRFYHTLVNKEVNIQQVSNFNKKFTKFNECAEVLKINGDKLISKCSDLKIPGKYIFRHEHYTDEIIRNLNVIENKIYMEKHKYFDYSGKDSLFLTQELIMIIPLTNCVFSYVKNSYKKIQVNFDLNKIKVKSFLPGCASLHLGNNFYVTGGEIKDEASSNFLCMNIDEKVIEEGPEMNFNRRYHTMVSLNKKYICVVGGWSSNEVEIIDTDIMDYWKILPNMHNSRSDSTVCIFNGNYIYVFGGWDFTRKTCVGEVERYEIFDSEFNIRFNQPWEVIKIQNNPVYLKKYNMGLIHLHEEKTDSSEKILLIGGFDEEYDYSPSVIKVELMTRDNSIFVCKDIKGLPIEGESSFWYEKNFHIMFNDFENEPIAVNFNCFNNIFVYSLRKSEFKLYTNTMQNK